MQVRATQNFATVSKGYTANEVYEVEPTNVNLALIASGHFEVLEELPKPKRTSKRATKEAPVETATEPQSDVETASVDGAPETPEQPESE